MLSNTHWFLLQHSPDSHNTQHTQNTNTYTHSRAQPCHTHTTSTHTIHNIQHTTTQHNTHPQHVDAHMQTHNHSYMATHTHASSIYPIWAFHISSGLSLIDYGVYQCHNQSDRSTTARGHPSMRVRPNTRGAPNFAVLSSCSCPFPEARHTPPTRGSKEGPKLSEHWFTRGKQTFLPPPTPLPNDHP